MAAGTSEVNDDEACSDIRPGMSEHACLLRFLNAISSFRSGVRLSAALVEPLLRTPPLPVQGGTRDVALRPDLARGLAVLVQLHDPAFELLLIMTWTTRIGHDHQLLRCPAPQ